MFRFCSAFLILVILLPSSAHADLAFFIDCYHTSLEVTDEGTDDIVTLQFISEGLDLGSTNQNTAVEEDSFGPISVKFSEPKVRFNPFDPKANRKPPSPDSPKCSALMDAEYTVSVDSKKYPISDVNMRTSGDDALFIDEARLYQGKKLIAHWGRDDGMGYCLSKDKDDAHHFGSYVEGCHSGLHFIVKHSKVRALEE